MSGPLGTAFTPGALKQAKPKDYAIRFCFGGAITFITGLIAHAYGPHVGGLFLAFPAILPASATLLEKKEGREQAAQDALGAAAGGVGLLAFALVIWRLAPRLEAWLVLLIAAGAWLGVAVAVWAAGALRHR